MRYIYMSCSSLIFPPSVSLFIQGTLFMSYQIQLGYPVLLFLFICFLALKKFLYSPSVSETWYFC